MHGREFINYNNFTPLFLPKVIWSICYLTTFIFQMITRENSFWLRNHRDISSYILEKLTKIDQENWTFAFFSVSVFTYFIFLYMEVKVQLWMTWQNRPQSDEVFCGSEVIAFERQWTAYQWAISPYIMHSRIMTPKPINLIPPDL